MTVRIIGQNGAVIFLRHGGSAVAVHRCRLKPSLDKVEKNNENMITLLDSLHAVSTGERNLRKVFNALTFKETRPLTAIYTAEISKL